MIELHNRIEIAKEFASQISSEKIVKMILFGSVARGDDSEESDIDILIVTNRENPELESTIRDIVVDYILKKEVVISPFVMSEEYFNKTKDYSFLKNVIEEGVLLD